MPTQKRRRRIGLERQPLRVVYFGTPDFAVPALRALAHDPRFDVRLVVTQPDRPAGRGRRIEASPVADAARDLGLPLHQPATLRTAEARQPLADADADLFVVAAFGLIFGKITLAMPRLGCVNLHASLLPQHRGASPILAALLCGDETTGVTLMRMDAGLDTGDIIAAVAEPIAPGDTTASLTTRLAAASARLSLDALPRFAAGELPARPQPAAGASLTRLLTKADGWVDWTRPAAEIARQVRAMWPWPRAWTTRAGGSVQIHQATALDRDVAAVPGTLLREGGAAVVACGSRALRLDVVQPAGRNPMPGAAFAAGLPSERVVLGLDGGPEPQPPIVVDL
ncbi:MAG: methionyl-tRNA formyltransferase [Thermomicrobiales bacterium]|nr:methionyl-tRNA formyltransferase [Thermomicrobiales bacterium]